MPSRLWFASRPERLSCNSVATENGCAVETTAQAPDKRQNVPGWVMDELIRRLTVSRPNLQSDVCYGTLLSREPYAHDISSLKYRDARELPGGPMTRDQIEIWTLAIRDRINGQS
jgi:hypothetical protein